MTQAGAYRHEHDPFLLTEAISRIALAIRSIVHWNTRETLGDASGFDDAPKPG